MLSMDIVKPEARTYSEYYERMGNHIKSQFISRSKFAKKIKVKHG